MWRTYHASTTEIIMEHLGDTLVTQGNYEFNININTKEIDEHLEDLRQVTKNWYTMCVKLELDLRKLHCVPIYEKQKKLRSELMDTQKYIKLFFGTTRSKRSWSFWNDMDADDRIRVDKDLDKLRYNEESIKDTAKHQTAAIDEMYRLMNKSVLTIDEEAIQLTKKMDSLKVEVSKDSQFVNSIKRRMYIETGLVGLQFWVEDLVASIKVAQKRILDILLEKDKTQVILSTLGPNFIETYLNEENLNLTNNLTIPKRVNGVIDGSIIKIIDYSFSLQQKYEIKVLFKVPLVKREPLTTRRVTIAPYVNGSTITMIDLCKNMILNIKDTNWGYTLTFEEWSKCVTLGDIKLCNTPNKEENFLHNDLCVTNILYKNNTNNCNIRSFKTSHDIWFSTENRNTWKYVTPHTIALNISQGSNFMTIKITGTGEFKLKPNMSIQTRNVKLSYFDEIINPITYSKYEANLTNITIEDWKVELLPLLNSSEKVYSFIDQNKLFEIGVDINNLKSRNTLLENLVYAPYNYPWWFSTTMLTIGGGILVFLLCVVKGKVSCCEKKYVTEKRRRNNNQPDVEVVFVNQEQMKEGINIKKKETTKIEDIELQELSMKPLTQMVDEKVKNKTTKTNEDKQFLFESRISNDSNMVRAASTGQLPETLKKVLIQNNDQRKSSGNFLIY